MTAANVLTGALQRDHPRCRPFGHDILVGNTVVHPVFPRFGCYSYVIPIVRFPAARAAGETDACSSWAGGTNTIEDFFNMLRTIFAIDIHACPDR